METDIAEREQFRHFLPDELDGTAGDCWRVKPPPIAGVGVAPHQTFSR